MLCPVFWRRVCFLAVILPVVYTASAAGQSLTQCPSSPAAGGSARHIVAEQTQATPTALETPVWKTITVGGSKGINAIRLAIETAPCHMVIGDDADEILGRPAFPFIRTPTELDLVVLSVFELGFGDQWSRNDNELGASVEASLRDIYARAITLGFELCPAEVGPALRLNYLDQPLGEFLHIAMKPVARYTGELVDFTVGNGGAGLLLIGGNGHPDVMLPGAARFVFIRPRADAIAGSTRRQSDEDLAKR
jgi:hypothetical protein